MSIIEFTEYTGKTITPETTTAMVTLDERAMLLSVEEVEHESL